MSRRAFSLVLSIVPMLVMALAATGATRAAPSKAKDKAYHARNVKYWTPARMADAVPRDFFETKGSFKLAAKGGTKPSKRPRGEGGSTDSGGSSATKSGVLNSVNSYKYNGGKKRYYMFGPKFNTRTEALYESIVP